MSRNEICPSCGTKLGAAHARASMKTCSSCQRSNPAGFSYCGFCATPMEDTQMRARMSELAAPPGGWPSLTSELVEVRFYLQQGLLDDAYELLSIMQKRHPGHPQLDELSHRPKPSRRVDTDTIALVDSVLAESANLVGKMPRRAAPRWKAPAASASPPTAGHAPARAARGDDVPTPRASRSGKTGANQAARATRSTGAQREVPRPGAAVPTTSGAGPRTAAKSTGSQRPVAGQIASPPTRVEAPEPAPPRERTRIYRTVEPPRTVVEARAAELAQIEAARASRPLAVVPVPVRATDREQAARGKAARAAERAEAARVAEQAAAERARTRSPRTPTGPRAPATEVVDALQPAAPWRPQADEPRPKSGRKRRDVDAAALAPAAAAPAPAESKEAPKRRASFGEHVLNRLR